MTRTKLVCTIGPSSATVSKIRSLIRAGMRVARLNFSHATHKDHARLIRVVRQAEKESGIPVAILADLQGPKIRVGQLDRSVAVHRGDQVVFADAPKESEIPVTCKGFTKGIKKGDRVLLEDGLLDFIVTKKTPTKIVCKTVTGGMIRTHKGMNFPDSSLALSALTKKDREDLVFALSKNVDWIALSFVMSENDVKGLRRLVKKGAPKGSVLPRIMSKIEKHEAVDGFEAILNASDGIMIARGDLGIEIPAEEVPIVQKRFIEQCRLAGKPVVVATQMLDSMIRNPRATRAEISDVANAVFDHTDAVMLSGESATGTYPIKAAKTMMATVEEAEASEFDDIDPAIDTDQPMEASVSHALKMLARTGEIDGIISSIELADWSERLLMARPEIPLFLAATHPTAVRQLAVRWGVIPMKLAAGKPETFAKRAVTKLKKEKRVKKGMRLAVVLGGEHGDGFDTVIVK